MTLSERRKAALDKCNEICHREYAKYLEATTAARNEYFAMLKEIDGEAVLCRCDVNPWCPVHGTETVTR